MNELKTQVVIVGAGPTGLSLAVQLLRYDIGFIIIDKNEKTTQLSKALAVQARTLEIFDETSLAKRAMNAGQIFAAANLLFNGKLTARLNISKLGESLSPFPFFLCLEQSKTEKLLIDYLLENDKQVQWQCSFSHFEQNEKGIIVSYEDPQGKQHKIEADYLVGCDGAHSQVRHQLGYSFEGDTVAKLFYVVDVKLKSEVINRNELYANQIKKGFILFFPMEGDGHYRIVGILPDATEKNYTFADVEQPIKQTFQSPLEFEEVLWFSSYKVHSRMANSFGNDRCFIAGDAAHIHTPAGGKA